MVPVVSVSESWKLPLVRPPGLITTGQRDFKGNVLRQKGQLYKQRSRTEGRGRVQPSLLRASPRILLPEIVCPFLRALCSQWLEESFTPLPRPPSLLHRCNSNEGQHPYYGHFPEEWARREPCTGSSAPRGLGAQSWLFLSRL